MNASRYQPDFQEKEVPLYMCVPEFYSPGCKDSQKGPFFGGTPHFTLNPKPDELRSTLHSLGLGSNPKPWVLPPTQ